MALLRFTAPPAVMRARSEGPMGRYFSAVLYQRTPTGTPIGPEPDPPDPDPDPEDPGLGDPITDPYPPIPDPDPVDPDPTDPVDPTDPSTGDEPSSSAAGRYGFVLVAPIPLVPTYSSVAEDEIPLWEDHICYTRGDEVKLEDETTWIAMFDKVEDRINNCDTLYNVNKNPATAKIPNSAPCMYDHSDYPWWMETEETQNQFRMFDGTLERETLAISTLEVHITPETKIDALCIFGITAASVRVESPRYEREDDLKYAEPLFPSVVYHDQFIELDFPHEVGDVIKLFFTGVGPNSVHLVGTIRVGMVVAGVKEPLGLACYSTEVGIRDYSQKDRDVFGMPTIREDAYSEWIKYSFEAETPDLFQLKQIVSKYRAEYVAYIGLDTRPETCIFGMYQDFLVPVESYSVCTGILEVLSAPIDPHRRACPVDPLGLGQAKTVFCDLIPLCEDPEPVPEGGYGACQDKTVATVCGNEQNLLTGMAIDTQDNVIEVGLNGAIFVNDKRTPFSPWYAFNVRDICSGPEDLFVIVGDNGLIATMTAEPPYAIARRADPFEGAQYHSVIQFRAERAGRQLYAAISSCGQVAFSVEGIKWVAYEDLPVGYESQMDPEHFIIRGATAVAARPDYSYPQVSAFLAVTAEGDVWCRRIHEPWNDYTDILMLTGLRACAIGVQGQDMLLAVANGTTIALRTENYTDTWETLEIPEGIETLTTLGPTIYVSTLSGRIMTADIFNGQVRLGDPIDAAMGTLSYLGVHVYAGEYEEAPGTPAV